MTDFTFNLNKNNQNQNQMVQQKMGAENCIADWLRNTDQLYMKMPGATGKWPWMPYVSPKTTLTEPENSSNDPVIIITQFYITKNNNRTNEIRKCLALNAHNNQVSKIYLLNEKIYSDKELGTKSDKIEQVNIGGRLKYSDVFSFVEKENVTGFICILNSDIFFDKSTENIKRSGLENEKKVFCQLRYEYKDKTKLADSKLFGPRQESQDAWIFHSSQNIDEQFRKMFAFNLGVPGCDNKIVYLFNIIGYQCYNEPELIKCYHCHNINSRSYDVNTKSLPRPLVGIVPTLKNHSEPKTNYSFNILKENERLFEYVKQKVETNSRFIIPRIAGIENNYAALGAIVGQNKKISDQQKEFIQKTIPTMKNNAGIKITDINNIVIYSKLYLDAFHQCDLYLDWEPWGDVVTYIQESYNFITLNFKRDRIWSFSMDVFHNIYNNPWTLSLRGKRILIISSFVDSIKEKIDDREKIYGVDLFPDCKFVFLKPPQTQGENQSREFVEELKDFHRQIDEVINDFDVALVSCGGYGNLVCSYIYQQGKSAIYVGGVLQMYFGIYGERWVRERPDVLNFFMNKHWSRPKESEKPKNNQKIENNCYW
jgi:hypothetical protein